MKNRIRGRLGCRRDLSRRLRETAAKRVPDLSSEKQRI